MWNAVKITSTSYQGVIYGEKIQQECQSESPWRRRIILEKYIQECKRCSIKQVCSSWKGPYLVDSIIGQGAHELVTLEGKLIPKLGNQPNSNFIYLISINLFYISLYFILFYYEKNHWIHQWLVLTKFLHFTALFQNLKVFSILFIIYQMFLHNIIPRILEHIILCLRSRRRSWSIYYLGAYITLEYIILCLRSCATHFEEYFLFITVLHYAANFGVHHNALATLSCCLWII